VIRALHPKQIRIRLTLWYVCALATTLVVTESVTASFLFFHMRNQLSHYAILDVEIVDGLLYFDAGGRLLLHEEDRRHEGFKLPERLVEVRSPEGAVLYRNQALGGEALGGDPAVGEGVGGYSPRSMRLANGMPVHVVSLRYTLDGRPLLIRLAYSEEPIRARIEELALASLVALPFVLALAGLGGLLLARRALAPLAEMASRAGQITSDRLHERLPIGNAHDELGRLAGVFNNLLSRLEQAFEQLRRFTSDVSHELRTPLSAIRSVGEVALQKDEGREEYRDAIGSMLEEVNRLTDLIERLLTITRADAGGIQLHPTVFRAIDLAREAAGLFDPLVEERGQKITVDGDEAVTVSADRALLRQALVNIIDNAVKYSPPGGAIHVGVQYEPSGTIHLEVVDSGPGIAPEHAVKIFNRFYRVDDARSRQVGGAGLGLSIAQWAVRVHGGDIHLLPTQAGGCMFRICLPPSLTPVSQS
jgi:heavy metal sensor kinase